MQSEYPYSDTITCNHFLWKCTKQAPFTCSCHGQESATFEPTWQAAVTRTKLIIQLAISLWPGRVGCKAEIMWPSSFFSTALPFIRVVLWICWYILEVNDLISDVADNFLDRVYAHNAYNCTCLQSKRVGSRVCFTGLFFWVTGLFF